MGRTRERYWYALNAYKDYKGIVAELRKARVEIYIPQKIEEDYSKGKLGYREVPMIPHIVFVFCSETFLVDFKRNHSGYCFFYGYQGTGKPGIIPDSEMNAFMLITRVKSPDVSYLGEDRAEYHVGDRVRVIDGLYKGAEGHIKRIKKSRQLIVSITGIAVVAISHIHPQYLEKI